MYYNSPSFENHYDQLIEKIRLKILSEKDDFIIGTTPEELVEYYYTNNSWTPIVIDDERTPSIELKKEVKIVPARQREYFYQDDGDLPFEYEWLKITIPIRQHMYVDRLIALRTNTFTLSGPPKDVVWKGTFLTFNVEVKGYGYDYNEDEIARRVQEKQNAVTNHIHLIAESIKAGNERLKSEIHRIITSRKDKLTADVDKYASLFRQINIPLKLKENESVRRIQIDTNPIVQRVRPTQIQPENFIIDRDKVLDIISIMDNQGRQFEKTPNTYKNSGEEDLRNILLVNLNSVFEGKATGETFHNKGKTDIHLNIAKGDILICECKIWGGQSLYTATIDQLQSYLTWRENYGIMITFIRGTKASTVLTSSESAIQSHVTFMRNFKKITETHFQSTHRLTDDDQKYVEIHHLFYKI